MAGLFCNSPELQRLEKQMRQPPGYRARGHGSIEDMSEWKEMGAYSEIVDYVIDRMHLEYLKKRIGEIFDQTEDELFFYDSDHKKRFYLLWSGSKENTLSRLPNYAATVFLLSADEKLPSVRELAAKLAINPNTIQKAYRDLESEGYIYTVTGKGTFVAERKEVYDARAKELLTEFDEIVEELFFLSVKEKELVERMDNLAEGKVDQ